MAETLMICSQGTRDSIISSLLDATVLKGLGVDIAILFYQEPLVSFAEGRFPVSPILAGYAETITETRKKKGLPTDPTEAVRVARGAGLLIYACGAWADNLGVRDKLPAEMEVIEALDALKLMAEAKKIIG